MSRVSRAVRPEHGFYALGGLCFGLGLLHYLLQQAGLQSILETFMILGLASIVLYTGSDLQNRPISTDGQWRALALGLGVAMSFTLLSFAIWVTWSIDSPSGKFSFLLTFAATLGAATGTQGALYAVQSNDRLAQMEELGKLLRINQRVLRHNLRNDLSVALGYLELVESADHTDDVREELATIRAQLESLLETSDRTRQIVSIWDNDDLVLLDLVSVVENEVADVRERHPDAAIQSDIPDDCRVRAHSSLPLAVNEAVSNAVEHNPADVEVTVSASVQSDGTTVLEVVDTGSGIPKFDRDAITLAEETALSHTQGLGLWILYWTVEMSDGSLEFVENDPHGTIVRMTLQSTS